MKKSWRGQEEKMELIEEVKKIESKDLLNEEISKIEGQNPEDPIDYANNEVSQQFDFVGNERFDLDVLIWWIFSILNFKLLIWFNRLNAYLKRTKGKGWVVKKSILLIWKISKFHTWRMSSFG